MSNVEKGGETGFPRAGGKPQPQDFSNCEGIFKVTPRKGKVILFYSLKPDGSFDEYSLHGGCAVAKGEKWAANKW